MFPKIDLTKPSRLIRSTVAFSGVEWSSREPKIDSDGGKFSAGIIRRFAVMTVGEAIGHNMWCDAVLLEQVASAINRSPHGMKMRFSHPGISGDSIGTAIGRAFNAVIDGEVLYADMHILRSASDSPKGDLRKYILKLAAEDPAAFGASIAFRQDAKATRQFVSKHTTEGVGFVSPDKRNERGYPHVRLERLQAVDIVDSPATNPSGFFSDCAVGELLDGGTEVLDYIFSDGADCPKTTLLGVHPARVKAFVQRHLNERGLSIVKRSMADMPPEVNEKEAIEETPKTTELSEPVVEKAEPESIELDAVSSARQEIKRYVAEFGAVNGSKWFSEGLSFTDATIEHCKILKAENEALARKVVAMSTNLGEAEPLSGAPDAADRGDDLPKAPDKKLEAAIGPSLAKFAQNIRVPSRN